MSKIILQSASDNAIAKDNEYPEISVQSLPDVLNANRIKVSQTHKLCLRLLNEEERIEQFKEKEKWINGFESHLVDIQHFLYVNEALFDREAHPKHLKQTEHLLTTLVELNSRLADRRKEIIQEKKIQRLI